MNLYHYGVIVYTNTKLKGILHNSFPFIQIGRINDKILKLPINLNLTTLNINHYSRLTILIQRGFKQRLCFTSIINMKNNMINIL